MIRRLIDLAACKGHTVEFVSMSTHSGLVMPGKVILINSSNRELTQRAALAHELGHIHYGHDWRLPHDSQRDELKADMYAAELLIRPADYARAEALHTAVNAIAVELDVPTRYVQLWQQRRWHLTQRTHHI